MSENIDQLKMEAAEVKELFVQKRTPLFQNKVFLTEDSARKSRYGQVKLVQSTHTGFVFNQAFDESLMVYDVDYHNEQNNSAFYKKHQDDVYRLLKSLGIDGKKVVEIGCGKGHFVTIMQEHNIDCTGFDPAYDGNDPAIVLRHVLEHIGEPHSFLQEIAKANNYKGYIFIEVPAFDWIVAKKAFWDIFYEHCNYFTEESLATMFGNAKTGKLFGDQYIYCYAALESLRETILPQAGIQEWDLSLASKMEEWKDFITGNPGIIVWGAGAKGSTFVNLLDPDKNYIKAVIDINPEKQNKYIALSGHPVYSPDKLAGLNCNTIIVMNENYLEEIKEQVREMNLDVYIINL